MHPGYTDLRKNYGLPPICPKLLGTKDKTQEKPL